MSKITKLINLKNLFKDGMTIMVGGFLNCGTPENIIDFLVNLNIKNLTVICNDTAFPDKGIGKLIVNGQVSKVIASHIGTNPETGKKMTSGELEVELSPQGTLIERIRAGGSGLGGVLTPTGVDTIVEKGKQKVNVNGKKYLLELPLSADISLIKGSIVDEFGNTFYRAATKNFNPYMAMAGNTVIVEADKLVKADGLNKENIMTPGILVDYIVKEVV
ncbi:3-oxoacid CoA-transferase subunit A [Clostridium sp. BL-8]|uniref:3-oxoacid CoA-transferase subunit A n=1 Tax=Clostridium sp. BL-8 TaxID=349938 RepID=UPI00098C9C8A|nr:3-oxoacid CoA-transferase subunit A [Clostridium sp. BL-8]OOM75633.1 butyrate--acetoacetate CoA-transferase subunit A [Clostridium sp. BL-8]